MRDTIIGIGWFVRRSADPQRLGEFYRDIVGFPELRNYGPTKMLWMGETVDLEPGAGGSLLPPDRSPDAAPCLPVILTRSLSETAARLGRGGVQLSSSEEAAWLIDPAGNAVGVAEQVEASRSGAWEPGPNETVEGARLPADLIRLAKVVRRCADPDRVSGFYRDLVGLRALEAQAFDLGGGSVLQIAGGGAPLALPEDRSEVVDGFILRVERVDEVFDDLVRRGAPIINRPFDIEGGRIAYLADPEGQVFGIQTRLPTTNRVEDHEAFRRRNG